MKYVMRVKEDTSRSGSNVTGGMGRMLRTRKSVISDNWVADQIIVSSCPIFCLNIFIFPFINLLTDQLTGQGYLGAQLMCTAEGMGCYIY